VTKAHATRIQTYKYQNKSKKKGGGTGEEGFRPVTRTTQLKRRAFGKSKIETKNAGEKKNRELGEEGIRPVTPDNRVLETRFREDGDGVEVLQERLLECDEEHENRQHADLELFYQRIHEEKVGETGVCVCVSYVGERVGVGVVVRVRASASTQLKHVGPLTRRGENCLSRRPRAVRSEDLPTELEHFVALTKPT
jgi:hypothetical protein